MLMIKLSKKFLSTALTSVLLCLLSSCGFGHASQRTFEGSYTRYSGDHPIQEHWNITIYEDGSCSAINTANGFKNYTHEFTGTWSPVSEDVIELNMLSEPYTSHVTKSNDEVDRQLSRAQTKRERNKIYRDASKLTYRTSQETQTFYIRKDGATSQFRDGLDNPIMICK